MRRRWWFGVLALVAACGGEVPEQELPARAAPAGGEDDSEQPGATLAERPPLVQRLEVELASSDPTEPAQIFVTYAEALDVGKFELELDDGQLHAFNDIGVWPDEIPYDGVYSGQGPVDLGAEAERAAAYLERVGAELEPSIARFEGRRLVELLPFDSSPFEQLAALGSPAAIESLVGQRFALYDAGAHHSGGGAPSDLTLGADAPPPDPTAALAVPEVVLTAATIPPPNYAPTHDWEKTLLIRDLGVVEDVDRTNVWELTPDGECQMIGNPAGPWAFQTLMQNIAHPAQTGLDLHEFVTQWVLHWGTSHSVQGDTVPAQYMGLYELWNDNVWAGWPRVWDDGNDSQFDDQLSMELAPFRLIAITNRVDLRGGGAYGGEAGELRFVFELIDPETCEPRPFNLILEYGVPLSGCNDTREWGERWYALDNLPLGDPAYNEALTELTEQVTSAGAAPEKPNGSAINQVRTNENFMVWPHYPARNWQLREFRLDQGNGLLKVAPLVQTPAIDWEVPASGTGMAPIDDYIVSNNGPILANTYVVGPSWGPQSPFQGAFSGYGLVDCFISPCSSPFSLLESRGLWWGTIHSGSAPAQREARHEFSLATCNGCHGREALEDADPTASVPGSTPDQPFRHVEGHGPGVVASLSRFLTGTHGGCDPGTNLLVPPLGPAVNSCAGGCCPVGDPVHTYQVEQVHFADLLRRQADLEALVSSNCLFSLTPVAAPAALSLSH